MKKFTKVLKKTGALLTMLALLISSVGLVSVSADVGEGNKIATIDDLWTKFGSQKTVLTLDTSSTGNDSTNYALYYHTDDGSTNDHDYMTIDYENGTSGNVVLKSGNGTDHRGVMSYSGMSAYMGNTRKQKWEVKVKLASANDVVHALAYAGNQWSVFSYYHDEQATAVKFEGGAVKLYDVATATWSNLYTGTVADQWYKVVRYMDFSTNGQNMQRVMLYSVANNGDETFLADSGATWLQAGTQTWRSGGQSLLSMGFDVTSATVGPVMFDDFGVYDMPAAPVMGVDANYVHGANKITTIDQLWTAAGSAERTLTPADDYLPADRYLMGATSSGHDYMTIGYENGTNGNVVLKSGNGTDNKGAFTFAGMSAQLGAARNQMWEIKFKLASTTDIVDVLPYGTDWQIYPYKYNSDNHAQGGSPIQIDNGAVKVKNDTTWTTLYSGLAANQWYKIVRYMDFNTNGNNKQRVMIYKVDNNGTASETLTQLADSGAAFLKAGAQTWRSGGQSTLATGVNVTKADVAPVMFDDFFAYEVESFALDTSAMAVNTASVKVGFSSPMKADTFDASAVTLSANGKNVELKNVSFDSAANSVIVEFNALQYATTYELTVARNVMQSADELPQNPAEPLVWSFTTEADPLSVGALSFEDAAGVVKGCATLINTTATERDYLVILAIYDDTTGAMENITSVSGKLANTAAAGEVIKTEGLAVATGKHAELFVWDSWNGLRPLTAKITQ